jgi:hypothetical protein
LGDSLQDPHVLQGAWIEDEECTRHVPQKLDKHNKESSICIHLYMYISLYVCISIYIYMHTEFRFIIFNPFLLINVDIYIYTPTYIHISWQAKQAKQLFSMQNQRFMFKSVHDGLGKDLYCTNAFLLVQHTTINCFNYTTISVYNSITVELYKHKYNYITTYLCNYMPMWLRSKQRAHHNRQKPSKLHGQAWPLALAKAASRVPGTCRSSPNPPGAC